MAASGEDLVKYVTERVVEYMETPKAVRKQVRRDRRIMREPWQTRWFGMVPLALRMWRDRWLRRK
ncbi:YqzE family protein [Paenibacillus filicis]|uniref:YqzE family protein n=1 Tax=Paenibacillus gyeongsangnamensis TaxID=3388067 RepID=A0ABT4QBX9_9BACL|nr:YqzE family protein [Paenibacillus filicis]MCZ8514366.1 YqzE family protein [Paenibacillus filicis]